MPHFKLEHRIMELVPDHPFGISRATKKSVHNVLISLSAGGITGYGEAAPNARYDEHAQQVVDCIEQLPPDFLSDVDAPSQLTAKLRGTKSLSMLKSARVALEMAWLDWWGQMHHQPLWKLWKISSPITLSTSFTIGLDELNIMQQKVREASDFSILKVKLGTDRDRQIIQAIREVTDKPLRVDANEGWETLDQAKKMLAFLEKKNIELVEQPMPSDRKVDLIELKKTTNLPICADESFTGRESLVEMGRAFDVVNIKLMKAGSLLQTREIMQKVKDEGLQVMIGCMLESSVGIAAAALLGTQADYVDLDGNLLLKDDPATGLTYTPDYRIQLSDRPGLGIEIKNHS